MSQSYVSFNDITTEYLQCRDELEDQSSSFVHVCVTNKSSSTTKFTNKQVNKTNVKFYEKGGGLFNYLHPNRRHQLQLIHDSLVSERQERSKILNKQETTKHLFTAALHKKPNKKRKRLQTPLYKPAMSNDFQRDIDNDYELIHPRQESIECRKWGPGGWAYLECLLKVGKKIVFDKHEYTTNINNSLFGYREKVIYHPNVKLGLDIMTALQYCIPAQSCRDNYNEYLTERATSLTSSNGDESNNEHVAEYVNSLADQDGGHWLFDLHNDVNDRTGKPIEPNIYNVNWMTLPLFKNPRRRVENIIVFKGAMLTSHNEDNMYHWNMFDIMSKFYAKLQTRALKMRSDVDDYSKYKRICYHVIQMKTWNTDIVCTGPILGFQGSSSSVVIGTYVAIYFSKTDKLVEITRMLSCKKAHHNNNIYIVPNLHEVSYVDISKDTLLTDESNVQQVVECFIKFDQVETSKRLENCITFEEYIALVCHPKFVKNEHNEIETVTTIHIAMLAECVFFDVEDYKTLVKNGIYRQLCPLYVRAPKPICKQNESPFDGQCEDNNNNNGKRKIRIYKQQSTLSTSHALNKKQTYCKCNEKKKLQHVIALSLANHMNEEQLMNLTEEDSQQLVQVENDMCVLEGKYRWCIEIEPVMHLNKHCYTITLKSGIFAFAKQRLAKTIVLDKLEYSPYYSIHISTDLYITNLVIHNTVSGKFHVIRVTDVLHSLHINEIENAMSKIGIVVTDSGNNNNNAAANDNENKQLNEKLNQAATILAEYIKESVHKPWTTMI